MISSVMCRCRAGKPMQGWQGAQHTIILWARSVWTCIFSSLPAWMSFQANRISCALMMRCRGQHRPRKSHPILRWLPTKLAAWIGENFGQELRIPPKSDAEWTAGELNAILENNLVPSHGGKGQL